MHNDVVQGVFEQYKEILQDYHKLLAYTQSFAQRMKQDIQSEDLLEFGQERERLIYNLQVKEAMSISLQEIVCQKLEISEFTQDNLSSRISRDMLEALSKVKTETQKIMKECLSIDTCLTQTLKMELEATKLNLCRLQSVKRLNCVYHSPKESEARFVDKMK